jgi:hypothetical protein
MERSVTFRGNIVYMNSDKYKANQILVVKEQTIKKFARIASLDDIIILKQIIFF